ncbi:NUCLEAR FUSION DEFECTIVE 4-like [Olea europaea subsp. europaea]|uniref:NUCLEAR FUSION DEFECTIVE 4-like n=1 Tax=Olea europaea subsp. europaea TaxID=158383 RepID=A0A8S0SZC5_OLEEU|nr:NUCLEAR FUSION DEFECTIVE 4-like [Olea europaea subsp. europaea]
MGMLSPTSPAGKWLGFVTAVWVQAVSGNNYTFSNYSDALKSLMALTQLQLNNLSVAKDVGKAFGILAGIASDRLPTSIILLIGSIEGFIGYGVQWLVVSRRIQPLPYWAFFNCLKGRTVGLMRFGVKKNLFLLKFIYGIKSPSVLIGISTSWMLWSPKKALFNSCESIISKSNNWLPMVLYESSVIHPVFLSLYLMEKYLRSHFPPLLNCCASGNLSYWLVRLASSDLLGIMLDCEINMFHWLMRAGTPRPIWNAASQILMAVGYVIMAIAMPGSLYVGSIVVGICYGVRIAVSVPTASELFGLKYYGLIYNILILNLPLGSFLFSGLLAGFLYDSQATRTAGGGNTCLGAHCYRLVFVVMAIACIIGFGLDVLLAFRTKTIYSKIYSSRRSKKTSSLSTGQ